MTFSGPVRDSSIPQETKAHPQLIHWVQQQAVQKSNQEKKGKTC